MRTARNLLEKPLEGLLWHRQQSQMTFRCFNIDCKPTFLIPESSAFFIIRFSPPTTSGARSPVNIILQCTLMEQVNKTCHECWGEQWDKHAGCHNPQRRSFPAVGCTEFNDGISYTSQKYWDTDFQHLCSQILGK